MSDEHYDSNEKFGLTYHGPIAVVLDELRAEHNEMAAILGEDRVEPADVEQGEIFDDGFGNPLEPGERRFWVAEDTVWSVVPGACLIGCAG